MNHNFKPGDLALALGGPFQGEAVELVCFLQPGDEVLSTSGVVIGRFNPVSKMPGWHVAKDGEGCVMPERQLMPLRGDKSPERQKSQEVPA